MECFRRKVTVCSMEKKSYECILSMISYSAMWIVFTSLLIRGMAIGKLEIEMNLHHAVNGTVQTTTDSTGMKTEVMA